MGKVLDRALGSPLVWGAVAAVLLLAALMVVVPFLRGLGWRRRPTPAVTWMPDTRPEEERLRPYAEELLEGIRERKT